MNKVMCHVNYSHLTLSCIRVHVIYNLLNRPILNTGFINLRRLKSDKETRAQILYG